MAVTQNSYVGDGSTTTYSFTFPYLKTSEIKASLDATVTTAFTTPTATTVQFNTAPGSGVKIKIYRETDSDSLTATFYAGSAIKSEDLNDNFTQNLYATQEINARYLSNLGGTMVGDLQLGEDVVIKFEGATDNAHETTLTVADPTADRTITLPNETGTIITSASTDVINSAHYVAGSIDLEHMSANSVDSDQYVDGSIDLIHMSANSVDSDQYVDGSIDHVHLANDVIDGDNIQDDAINSEHYAAGSIDLEHMSANSVDSDQYVDGSIDSAHIANDQIDSQHYAAGSIDLEHMSANSVDSDQYVDGSIDLVHMSANSVDSDQYVDGSIDHVHLANDVIDGDNIQDDVVNSEHIAAGAVDLEHMSANSVDSDQYVDGSIDRVHLSADIIDATKIEDDAVTTDHIQDAELTTLAGMPSGTASILASSTALTSTTTELNQLDGKTLGETTLTTNSDTAIPTSKAVNDRILTVTNALGGFVAIANETSFPATHPDPSDGAGTVVSVSDAGGVVVNGSGVASITNGAGSGNTVTINGFPSSLYSKTLGAGIGLQVQTTTTLHTYDYHKILAKEADVEQLSGDINDFNERYRVAGSAPGSNNDAGDLYFDTAANKMKVYNATTSTWDDVASVGNFFINTISSSSNTGGGSATFNGSAYRFTLSNAPTMAQQLIVSVNGVIQKPNAGSSQPSEGFAISGNDIIFSAAPASGSDYFIVTQGSSVSIGTPSDNTVATAKIQNLAVTNGKIADDTIAEVKLDISNAPADGKFLQYKDSSDKLTWATVDATPEGTVVKSTGESGTTKFLRVDGDGTCSWQVPPDTDTVYTHPNHSGEVTSTADGATVIVDDIVDEANLKISNAGTNGQFLQKQSGNTGGLTWADAGGLDSDSVSGTYAGTNAGASIITSGAVGASNTLIGYDAGTAITSGDNNTCVGKDSGIKITTGGNNVAIGIDTLNENTTQYYNVAIGDQALKNKAASKNVAVGASAAYTATSGGEGTWIGYEAGARWTGIRGIAIGAGAGSGNGTDISGDYNIAIGYEAMRGYGGANVSGEKNIAIGYQALTRLTTGDNNLLIGYGAGDQITTGESNHIVGNSTAAYALTTGDHNCGIGAAVMFGVTTGSYNSGLGLNACASVTTGDNNTCIGSNSGGNLSPAGSIGSSSNIVVLGNTNVSNLYCNDTSISSSDKRDKTDITDFTHGLSWINKLKPVTYRWDRRNWYNEYHEDGSLKKEVTPDGSKKRARQHIGFLAQDVLEIEKADGFASKKDDMLVVNLNEDDTAYGLKYERLVPVLVNAIKELSTKVETLETKVAALEAK